jgi:Bardet-Biedl syndrome 4 protein
VYRSYLLGKHKAAIDVYDEAQRIGIEDWEIWHNKGLCQMYLKQYEKAADCFRRANSIQRHDATFMQLGKVCMQKATFSVSRRPTRS